jgi:pimeloyl-ACP methyl ester carboxylesterase
VPGVAGELPGQGRSVAGDNTHPAGGRRGGLTESWTTVGGRPVRSLAAGQRRAGVPPLVVVPGLGALGYLLPTVRACAGWTEVHLLDLPGFGHPVTAQEPADLASMATVTAGWLEQRRSPVQLFGHSTGAQAALRAALLAPGRVAHLALGGATFAPEQRSLPPLLAALARTLPHERPAELPAVLPYYLRGLRGGLGQLLRSALADRPEDLVGQVACPLTILRGEHDHLCPRPWAQRLRTRGRLLELPGGHNFLWRFPDVASGALRTGG